MSIISLRNLTVAYGKEKAVKNVTVDIPEKQITTIIGPSGCGKTTLLKSLNRLTDLNEEIKVEGEVLIDGENIYDPKTDVLALRKKVGFIPQKPYPLPMSIYDNVAFGPRIHGMKEEQMMQQIKKHNQISEMFENGGGKSGMDLFVEYYLRLAGLWEEVKDRLHSPASRLSVGQQQRLALARVLAIEPEIILADEPTSALDPVSAKLIEDQFKFLKNHYTIVLVTHILRQARRLADHAIFLFMGELIESGPADEVFNSPKNEKTRAYVSGEIS
jgi:phosphate transport system ATP-binding protein